MLTQQWMETHGNWDMVLAPSVGSFGFLGSSIGMVVGAAGKIRAARTMLIALPLFLTCGDLVVSGNAIDIINQKLGELRYNR
jgi:hypothetical protein